MTRLKTLALLGATGSIGTSTLDIVRAEPQRFRLLSVASGNSWQTLAKIAREFRPEIVAIHNEEHYQPLKDDLAGLGMKVLAGVEGVCEASAKSGAEMLVSAAVGASGLRPTLEAVEAGLDIALANKETLVMAGELVTRRVRERGVRLLPVDSEHSAVFQCLQAGRAEEVRRVVLTASGGPFRGKKRSELEKVTAAEALAHPTWNMGKKITIDCATLVNKALEVIEAHWLFGMPYERIGVVVHPQSVVHSLVEFCDGATVAQLGPADMRLPIHYALAFPERPERQTECVNLAALARLTFEEPDWESFPCLRLGFECGRAGGLAPAVYSAANEAAVELFLAGKLGFYGIHERLAAAVAAHTRKKSPALADILQADAWAREFVRAGEEI